MTELFLAVLIGFFGFVTGLTVMETNYQGKCVEKYAAMPHNQVGDYCKTILKFEKEAK
jgi:hypothetical protein